MLPHHNVRRSVQTRILATIVLVGICSPPTWAHDHDHAQGKVTGVIASARSGAWSQGQRELSSCASKDFQHVVLVPTARATFHGDAFLTAVLLQQGQSEAVQPRKVLA